MSEHYQTREYIRDGSKSGRDDMNHQDHHHPTSLGNGQHKGLDIEQGSKKDMEHGTRTRKVSHHEDVPLHANHYHSYGPPPPQAQLPGVRGNPGPFGLLCFGMTTCMLMFITTSWSNSGFNGIVMAYALFYGGLGQLIAGILELIRGSTFAGTAFSSYGCFWMGWALWHYWEASAVLPNVQKVALTGETLWCGLWGFLTLFFFIVTLRKNGCLQTIFGSLFITFFLLAGANYSAKCKLAAGYVGFFCGSSAIYAAIAELYQIELGWNLPGLAPTKYV